MKRNNCTITTPQCICKLEHKSYDWKCKEYQRQKDGQHNNYKRFCKNFPQLTTVNDSPAQISVSQRRMNTPIQRNITAYAQITETKKKRNSTPMGDYDTEGYRECLEYPPPCHTPVKKVSYEREYERQEANKQDVVSVEFIESVLSRTRVSQANISYIIYNGGNQKQKF